MSQATPEHHPERLQEQSGFPEQNLTSSVRFFGEFGIRSPFEGFSLQFSGAIRF